MHNRVRENDIINIYSFRTNEINGVPINFNNFKNKVIIIVNTASHCGFAPQLRELEKLYNKYHRDGLEIIGFPSNQFHQEEKNCQDAYQYCKLHYGVTFPMVTMTTLNGPNANPIFKYLEKTSRHGRIKWNYTKFLINRDGRLVHRYAPITNPKKMEPVIVKALKE